MKVKSHCDIFIGEFPFHKELKEDLVPLLEGYDDHQNRKTNVQATMTEWKWDPPIPRLKRLKKCIMEDVRSYSESKSTRNEFPTTLRFCNFFGNIYREGDYTMTHNHIPYYYSMVYFLKSEMNYSPLIFTQYGERIKPKEGTYVIWPSHLWHHVPKHKFKETRITLAANIALNY